MFHVSIWGDLELRLGRLSPPKAPVATRLNCAPYLFDCKPRLIKLFSSIHAACNQGQLTFLIFFTLSKGIDDAQCFLGYVLSTKLFFRIRFSSASRAHPSQEGL